MKKTLIVVDMQNDFISGALGTPEAERIVPRVSRKIEEYEKNGDEILFTRDTHFEDYLSTPEGKHLPVVHCVKDTWGWQVEGTLDRPERVHVDKLTFGYPDWKNFRFEEIEMVGVCTDICVISNALILKAAFPSADIHVDASCCAGVTPAAHLAALEVMKSCQIFVENEEGKEEKTMKSVCTEKAPAAIGPYSQAVITGGMVYTSGQIPIVPETGLVKEGCIKCQTKQVMENLGAVLEAAGATFESTVKTTCFLADIADFAAFNSVYEQYFTGKPARSCFAVKDLPKGVMVEVEAVAEIVK